MAVPTAVVAVLIAGLLLAASVRSTMGERAADKVAEAGYLVIDVDRKHLAAKWDCPGKGSAIFDVRASDDSGVEQTLEVCVTAWSTKIYND